MKKMTLFASGIGLTFYVAIHVSSCTKDKLGLPPVKTDSVPKSFCDSASVKYSSTIAQLMQLHCSGNGSCHAAGGPAPGDLTSYSELKSYIDNNVFQDRTFTQKDMPPTAPLDSITILKIKCWIEAGAPNN